MAGAAGCGWTLAAAAFRRDRTRNLPHRSSSVSPPVRRASGDVDVARRRGRRGRSRSGQHLPNCRSPAAHRGCSTKSELFFSHAHPRVNKVLFFLNILSSLRSSCSRGSRRPPGASAMPKRNKGAGAGKRSWEDAGSSSRPSSKPQRIVSCAASLPSCHLAALPMAASHISSPMLSPCSRMWRATPCLPATPVLTDDECDAWIRWGEDQGFVLEKHAQTSSTRTATTAASRWSAQTLRTRYFHAFGSGYPTQSAAGRHAAATQTSAYTSMRPSEVWATRRPVQSAGGRSVTEFTVLVYRRGGLEGGETVSGSHGSAPADDRLRFAPRRGACLVHAHGIRCLTHEGAEVQKGVKYLLRTDVAYV